MDISVIYSVLALAFGLGLLHALDADHIMAVSSMSVGMQSQCRWSLRKMLGFCVRWALGHSMVLIALAMLYVTMKIELPEAIPHLAEKLIGVLLIGLGIWVLHGVFNRRIALQVHSHDDITHVHLTTPKEKSHNHKPILVGITHGLAGSAPVLALIPATQHANPLIGIAYVLLFCLGVLCSMVVFGLCFNRIQNSVLRFSQRAFQTSRVFIGLFAVGMGSVWLLA